MRARAPASKRPCLQPLAPLPSPGGRPIPTEEFKELIKAMLSKPKYSVPLQVLKTVAAQMLLIPTVARFAKENVQALKGTPDIMVVPAIQAACTTMGIKF